MTTKNDISTIIGEEKKNKETTKYETTKNNSKKEKVFCPWIKTDSKCHSLKGMLKLHYEILDFYNFIQLKEDEKELRYKTFNFIKEIIDTNFPEFICELYGSFKTGLSLPNSDIDILIMKKEENENFQSNKESNNFLQKSLGLIYDVFKLKKEFTHLEFVNAKVPIIKCTYGETNINIDISIFKKNGIFFAKQIEEIINVYPEIRPLMLIIKYMLRQRDLNEIYLGGVSSFIIFTLLYYYIIDVNKRVVYSVNKGEKEKLLTLGHLLLGFFNFYGYDFNYKKLGISIRNGCFLYERKGDSKHILSVENFQDIYQDLGKSCYKFNQVIDVFKYASKYMSYIGSPVVSYLGGFILPDDILRERAIKYK